MADECVSVLEVGTSWVTVLTGEHRKDGGTFITGIGHTPSCGVRKGVVVDIDQASACVRSAVEKAETSSGKPIREVFLLVSGGHAQSFVNHISVAVDEPGGEITEKDIEKTSAAARAVSLPDGQDILHTIAQKFAVDDHDGIRNPLGMTGSSLSIDMLVVHASVNLVNNTVQAVIDAGLDVADVAFSGLCAALATLTPEQKNCGVLLVDLGGGVTSYLAYSGGAIAAAGGIAVGGDHITSDISFAFNVTPQSSVNLKHTHGAAMLDPSAYFQRVSVPEELGFPGVTFSLSDLNTVIHARMDELFGLVREQLAKSCDPASLGAGIVLTGGGAALKRVDELAAEVFGLPCAIGRPRGFFGLTALSNGPEKAAPLGMLRYALRSRRFSNRSGTMSSLLRRFLGGR